MRNKFSKILIIFFLLIFIFQLASLVFLLSVPTQSNAESKVQFTPQIGVGTDFEKDKTYPVGPDTIGLYIKAIYKYAIGVVGILSAVVMMWGGLVWLTAGGSSERVTVAKSWISASLTGLVLALCSFMILATINPDLTKFQPITVKDVKPQGCCTTGVGKEQDGVTKEECSSGKWASGQCSGRHGRQCNIEYYNKKYTGEAISTGTGGSNFDWWSFDHNMFIMGPATIGLIVAGPLGAVVGGGVGGGVSYGWRKLESKVVTNSACNSFCSARYDGARVLVSATQEKLGIACCVCYEGKKGSECGGKKENCKKPFYCAVYYDDNAPVLLGKCMEGAEGDLCTDEGELCNNQQNGRGLHKENKCIQLEDNKRICKNDVEVQKCWECGKGWFIACDGSKCSDLGCKWNPDSSYGGNQRCQPK